MTVTASADAEKKVAQGTAGVAPRISTRRYFAPGGLTTRPNATRESTGSS